MSGSKKNMRSKTPAPANTADTLREVGRILTLACVGLSAFLLFVLELLSGEQLLPILGGSPQVWITALWFYSAVLFMGYLYAHLLVTHLGLNRAGWLHSAVVVVLAAVAALGQWNPASLPAADLPPAIGALYALMMLSGASAFLFSTTTPLLSALYAERYGDPWWLYSVSNAAGMTGLLAYPFVIEPNVPLSVQQIAIIVLTIALVAGLVFVLNTKDPRRAPSDARPGPRKPTATKSATPSLKRQALWVLMSFVPAGLLSATTNAITLDMMPSPLLWVAPLGIYLGSLVLAFSSWGKRLLRTTERLVPAAVTLMWIAYAFHLYWWGAVFIMLGSFAVLALAVHNRLAVIRPSEEHLTRFYLVVSAGGVTATAFVGLVAPAIFNDVYELLILIVVGLVGLAMLPSRAMAVTRQNFVKEAALRLAPFALISLAAIVPIALKTQADPTPLFIWLALGAVVVGTGVAPRVFVAATTVAIVAVSVAYSPDAVVQIRTYFGVSQVRDVGRGYSLRHGTTVHGVQFRDARYEPTSYYVQSGPLGDVMRQLQARLPGGASIGAVGLGIGTLAAYERPSDEITFFEVDAVVAELASDTRYFTYLSDAPNPPQIVIGDGRLSLAEHAPGSFDLLVIDAFSSDFIPEHLLTREAMRVYARALKPHGVVAFHLSNRYFNLAPAVASTAKSMGLDARGLTTQPTEEDRVRLAATTPTWVVVGKAEDVAAFDEYGWPAVPSGPVFTDNFADAIWALR